MRSSAAKSSPKHTSGTSMVTIHFCLHLQGNVLLQCRQRQ